MSRLGKWIGGGLGWVMGGPIGALLGFLVGSVVDGASGYLMPEIAETSRKTTPGGFGVTFLVLIAAVMKADGKVLKSELDYVKQFFVRQFGRETAREATIMLRDLLKQDIPLADVCRQIERHMDYSSRLQLLHLLFNISLADGVVNQAEQAVIEKIADYTGVSQADYVSIKNMFIPDTDPDYKILETDPSATDEEIKKAYRRMAMKYHPDKVSHLGEDFRKAAGEKFRKVNEAYKRIREERNMK